MGYLTKVVKIILALILLNNHALVWLTVDTAQVLYFNISVMNTNHIKDGEYKIMDFFQANKI
jgi:hypothetical protein